MWHPGSELQTGRRLISKLPCAWGLDLNKHTQTTAPMVAPEKDRHVDLTGINVSPESKAKTDETPTMAESVDLG